jgi:hypothetical protein
MALRVEMQFMRVAQRVLLPPGLAAAREVERGSQSLHPVITVPKQADDVSPPVTHGRRPFAPDAFGD